MALTTKNRAKPGTAIPEVPAGVWSDLYQRASQVLALQPWTWMEESDVFGVQPSRGGEPAFVSVMGQLGEYRAVALYPGLEALDRFWKAHDSQSDEVALDLVLGTQQIHLAFGTRMELEAREKRLLKELGLKFRSDWPLPRSRWPGHTEWFVDEAEARLLISALDQVLDVAPRFRTDRSLLGSQRGEHSYLIRSPGDQDAAAAWRDEHRILAPPKRTRPVFMPGPGLSRLRSLPRSRAGFELDIFPSGNVIGKLGGRGQIAFLFLVADSRSGMILTADALTATPTWDDLWDGAPDKLFTLFDRIAVLPATLDVKSERLFSLLGPACQELGIALRRTRDLKALDAAREGFQRFSGV